MKRFFTVLLVMALLLLVACTVGTDSEESMEVTDVWGRNSPAAAENGAFYMTITNNTGTDDILLSADADVCNAVELHEMYMKENDVMGMRPVPDGKISIPNGETAELKVGGLHVMCLGKTDDLTLGAEVPITLTFENAGEIVVTAAIRDEAPGGMDMEQ
jgi:copper(I)-binding protein